MSPTKHWPIDTERLQVRKPVKPRTMKLQHRNAQCLLKPFCHQMPMTKASTSLDVSGALMTKQNRRITESE
jgi:hypothetical protein